MAETDLETYRVKEKLSYSALARLIGVKQARQARSYALGESWPAAPRLEIIRAKTGGGVTLQKMHERRLRFLAGKRRRQGDGSRAHA